MGQPPESTKQCWQFAAASRIACCVLVLAERERPLSLTFARELAARAGDLQPDPPPPLGVLAAAEVGHRLLAFLVHVHITGCG